MRNTIFEKQELPLEEFKKLGLYKDGEFNIAIENIEALLAGRRTELISLQDLNYQGIEIPKLDAKLSLNPDNQGNLTLSIHPIYKEPQLHPLLNYDDSLELISGKKNVITKEHTTEDNRIIHISLEYDKDTKEFIAYQANKIPKILQVNGVDLLPSQQEKFQKGEIIELLDGTKFQHSATDSKGVLSNKKRLIISVLLDGGISYVIFRGLKNLKNNYNLQDEGLTKNYNDTLAKIILSEKEILDKQITVGEYKNSFSELNKDNASYQRKTT